VTTLISILIVFFSLIALAIIHEFGHFVVAKRFGTNVEEFGIGYPPRITGKKLGNTFYSLNWLPFGAFVRIKGEEGDVSIEEVQGIQAKPIWQRALIILGGVISFWLVSIILLTIIFRTGAPITISDATEVDKAKVQIISVAKESPAEEAGIRVGDTIRNIRYQDSSFNISKVKEVQEFTEKHKGEKVILIIERGKESIELSLIPRIEIPEGQGAIGIGLIRTVIDQYPLPVAFLEAIKTCLNLTSQILMGFGNAFKNAFYRQPTGVQLMGPIGIGSLMTQAIEVGFVYYLQLVALISIHLAIVNLLPIPAVDGGKLLFLGLEKIKGRPLNQKIERGVNSLFFILLIIIMFFVTIKDIQTIF